MTEEQLAYIAVGRQLTNLAGQNEQLRMELQRAVDIIKKLQEQLKGGVKDAPTSTDLQVCEAEGSNSAS